MAKSLAEYGIKTSLIPDAAIFTFLSKVTKVIMGTHSVMANGGLKAISGSYTLAEAAKHHNVPLIVLAAMFKYTPEYLVSHDQVAFNKCGSPQSMIPCNRGMTNYHFFWNILLTTDSDSHDRKSGTECKCCESCIRLCPTRTGDCFNRGRE